MKIISRLARQLIINTDFIVLSDSPDNEGIKTANKEAVAMNHSGCQLPVDKMTTEIIGVINTTWTSIVIAIH